MNCFVDTDSLSSVAGASLAIVNVILSSDTDTISATLLADADSEVDLRLVNTEVEIFDAKSRDVTSCLVLAYGFAGVGIIEGPSDEEE